MCLKNLERTVNLPFYNEIYNKSTFRCPKEGCQETPLGEDFEEHLNVCPFYDEPEPELPAPNPESQIQ
jgi:hypothetical protein